jgi:hypothetical protein
MVPIVVMPGLDPDIHIAAARTMDCRVKPGNDGVSGSIPPGINC